MMRPLLNKVYAVREKSGKFGVWLHHLVCETADLQEGDPLYISVDEIKEEIVLQNQPISNEDHVIHVSARLNKTSGRRRPLVDTAGERYSFLSFTDKVEIKVFREGQLRKIIVRPLHYKLTETCSIPTPKDERISYVSICSGAGIGSSMVRSTGYFTSVQEIELEEDSAEVLKHNFRSSYLFNGDLKDCHEVAEADMCLVTLPCSEHSSLGEGSENVMNNLILATAKIIKSTKASCLWFENVPSFYKSDSWQQLKEILIKDYPYFTERQIESWDFGSIATRNRKYVIAFSDRQLFEQFKWPTAPRVRRKKLKTILDGKHTIHDWKPLDKWIESFNSREAWKNRNLDKTFVTGDAIQINCVPKRYRSHCASSSYILNEDKTHWRFLSEAELFRIFDIPVNFKFPDHTPITRRYEMIGQSVCGKVFKAIANNIATTFMKRVFNNVGELVEKAKEAPISITGSGQLELIF